jgi:hypothetical protein
MYATRYTTRAMQTIARQRMAENARGPRRTSVVATPDEPRTWRRLRVTWHRQAVRTA